MRALTYSFWALVITIALLTTGIIKLMTDPTPPPIADIRPVPEDLYCYEPYGAPVEAEYILLGSVVVVNFIAHEDMPDGLEAYAEYVADFENNLSFCKITTVMPERMLGDHRMDALGHELLHCLTGAFHP